MIATIGLPISAQETDNFIVDNDGLDVGCAKCPKSPIRNRERAPDATDDQVDKRAFAQVEKWMAMIREIDAEPQAQTKRDD